MGSLAMAEMFLTSSVHRHRAPARLSLRQMTDLLMSFDDDVVQTLPQQKESGLFTHQSIYTLLQQSWSMTCQKSHRHGWRCKHDGMFGFTQCPPNASKSHLAARMLGCMMHQP